MGSMPMGAPPAPSYAVWQPWWAWRPVKLTNGKRAWLRKVMWMAPFPPKLPFEGYHYADPFEVALDWWPPRLVLMGIPTQGEYYRRQTPNKPTP